MGNDGRKPDSAAQQAQESAGAAGLPDVAQPQEGELTGAGTGEGVPRVESGAVTDARIVWLDDDRHCLEIVELMLRRVGYTNITCLTDPMDSELLARLRRDPPDVLLHDILHPGGGIEFYWGLKADPILRRIPVIVVSATVGSGYPDYTEFEEECRTRFGDECLSKPINRKDFLAAVARALSRGRLSACLGARWDPEAERQEPELGGAGTGEDAPRVESGAVPNARLVSLVLDEVAERLLRRAGYTYITCLTDRMDSELLARLRREPPDVVLHDISHPGFRGRIEFYWDLKADPILRRIPVIILLATVGVSDFGSLHVEFRPAGMSALDMLEASTTSASELPLTLSTRFGDECLRQPVKRKDFLAAVARACNAAAARACNRSIGTAILPGTYRPAWNYIGFGASSPETSSGSHIVRCPRCSQRISLPMGRGDLRVTCPRCSDKFVVTT